MHPVTTEILLMLGLIGSACAQARPCLHPNCFREQAACAAYLAQREIDRAETACTICLKYSPDDPACLNDLGLVWYLRGVDDKARALYQQALRSNPDFAQPYNNLGRLALDRSDYDKARRLFATAVRMNPAFFDALYNLALTDLRQGQQRFARGGGAPAGDQRLGDALANLTDAERSYRELIELAPDDVRGFADMGVVESFRAEMAPTGERRLSALARAEIWYLGCLQLQPAHVECHGNLAQLYLGSGRCEEAVRHLTRCLEIDPANLICRQVLAPATGCARAQAAARSSAGSAGSGTP